MNSANPRRAVLIDRDGTINVDRGFLYRIEEFAFIPGTFEALHRLQKAKIKIYIITNQSGIAMGSYTEADYHGVTEYMLNQLGKEGITIEEVLYCPHHPQGTVPQYRKNCNCRKPQTGMLESIIRRGAFKTEDLALIGDKNSDIEAGNRLGIRTYLVETGYGRQEKETTKAHQVTLNLEEAVDELLAFWGLA